MANFLGTCRIQGWVPVMCQKLKKALAHYRAEPEIDIGLCPLEWWLKCMPSHGLVAKLAFKYLAFPAVPCEWLFLNMNSKHASLNPDNNRLICLG